LVANVDGDGAVAVVAVDDDANAEEGVGDDAVDDVDDFRSGVTVAVGGTPSSVCCSCSSDAGAASVHSDDDGDDDVLSNFMLMWAIFSLGKMMLLPPSMLTIGSIK
jgi:hypothetical protein